jgi:hypothetical protein
MPVHTGYNAWELFKNERPWLNIVRAKKSVGIFQNSNWFSPVEDEYNGVMFKPLENICDCFNRVSWIDFLVSENKGSEIKEQNAKTISGTARWYIRRYSVTAGLKAIWEWVGDSKLLKAYLFLLPVLIFIFMICVNYKVLNETQTQWTPSILVYILIAIAPIPFSPFLLFDINSPKKQRDFVPLQIGFASLGLFMPRLLMAVSSAWLLFITTEELWKVSYSYNPF